MLPPSSSGRGATYGPEHLDRLLAWKRLRNGAPAGTTNAQLKALIDHLAENRALLQGVADGSIPFKLVDDQSEAVQVALIPAPLTAGASAAPEAKVPPALADSSRRDKNAPAMEYLARLRAGGKGALSTAAAANAPAAAGATLQLGANVAARSAARIPLDRLHASLAAWVELHAPNVRTKPVQSETWHRVRVGRDLTIAARGPLAPEELALLDAVGELLQRALYRTETRP